MIVVGCGGHAKDLLSDGTIERQNHNLVFFDSVNNFSTPYVFGKYPIVRSFNDLHASFPNEKQFVLAVGNPAVRKKLFDLFLLEGYSPINFVSTFALVSLSIDGCTALNIMPYASVFATARLSNGSLVNSYSSVHHDAVVGEFCEVSPGARILGGATINDRVFIGANASILPGVCVGADAIIGAGAVVTRDVPSGAKAIGVPARITRFK
jgi:sugar O-acyltransferase (sialic acid O-acetyltransferase NeuD family)